MATPDDRVELRGEIPRDLADVIDAVSLAKSRSRMGQIIAVLQDWAAEQRRIANVICAVTRVHPVRSDTDRILGGGPNER